MKNSTNKVKRKVSLIFIVFAVMLIFSFIFLEKMFLGNQAKSVSLQNAVKKTKERQQFFKSFLDRASTSLVTIGESKAFKQFLLKQSSDELEDMQALFSFVAKSDPSIMQLRYIDKDGKEQIRVDRKEENSQVYFVEAKDLQDKSQRPYFIESKTKLFDKVWFSAIDLNIEHKKVEVPHRPTLRAVLPVSKNGKFDGILIVNYFMKGFLNKLLNTPLYDIILTDGKGYILRHYDSSKNWGYYKPEKYSLQTEFPKTAKLILTEDVVVKDNYVSRKLNLPIEGGLILILQLKHSYIEDTNIQKIDLYISVIGIVLFFAAMSSVFLSSNIGKLYQELTNKLERSQLKFFTLFRESLDPIVLVDVASQKFVEYNQRTLEFYGYSKEEFEKLRVQDLDAAHNADEIREHQEKIIKNGWDRFTTKHLTKGGHIKDVNVNVVTITLDDKLYLYETFHDITKDKEYEASLKKMLDELETIYTISKDGIAIMDLQTNFLDFNEAYLEMTGFTREELLTKSCIGLTAPEDYELAVEISELVQTQGFVKSFTKTCIVKNERRIFVNMSASLMPDKQRILLTAKDLTAMKKYEQKLEHIAHYDALTGLPNRVLQSDRLKQAMLYVQRKGGYIAVVYLDLDGFKDVNDTYGHEMGDKVLIGVSSRMKQALREGDTLSRFGGDEFVAIIGYIEKREDAFPVIERLLHAASDPVFVGKLQLKISASIGVAFYSQEEKALEGDQLIRQADQAMYVAKQSGKNRYHIFEEKSSTT